MMRELRWSLLVAAAVAAPVAAQVTYQDYPPASLRAGEQGVVGFRLSVAENGVPDNCTVTVSSGYPRLDLETCRLMTERSRFKPALDANGKPTRATYQSRVTWAISDDEPPIAAPSPLITPP